jgi:hypothetical protein
LVNSPGKNTKTKTRYKEKNRGMKNDKGKRIKEKSDQMADAGDSGKDAGDRMQDARGWLEEQLRDGDFLKQA